MDKDTFEAADYVLDMVENKKRRKGGVVFDGVENDRLDDNYVKFMEDLCEFVVEKCVVQDYDDDDGDDDDEDDDDPSYKEFLNHLTVHGKAYKLISSIKNGVLFPIIYEAEDELPVVKKRGTPQSKLKTSDFGTPKSHSDDFVIKDWILDVEGNQSTSPRSSGSRMNVSESVDICYATFLSGLHSTKESVYFEYGNNRIYYESELVTPQRCSTSTQRQLGRPPKPSKSTQSLSLPPPRSSKSTGSLPTPTPSTRPSKYTKTQPTPPSIPSTSTLRPPVPPRSPFTPTQRPPTPPVKDFSTQTKQTLTDSHVSVSASTSKNKKELEELNRRYLEKLYAYLRKPYDSNEFEELEMLYCTRKRKLVHRESRSGGSFREGEMGKSYLEHHPGMYLAWIIRMLISCLPLLSLQHKKAIFICSCVYFIQLVKLNEIMKHATFHVITSS
ncbi:uncharacterized protein LOC130810011 isoform X3 [Amaranthus tricolor]|uniref:uncharacterized protein LOC130810011 isoform X3 n=1 Tax=Amaranthus tricolor TaxID=29722 RepID=UPI0025903A78|nr:uncharacterized protein LOC130810011 isoform X3 [Amaranthus tricolor]